MKGIYFGEDVPADDPRAGRFLQGPNQWPKLPRDEFHAPIMDYRKRLLDLSNVLLRIIAEGLPYGPNIFDDFVVGPVGNVRLLHYPPQESKDELQLGGLCPLQHLSYMTNFSPQLVHSTYSENPALLGVISELAIRAPSKTEDLLYVRSSVS